MGDLREILNDENIELTNQELLAYVQGKADRTLQRKVELKIAKCPFTADAVEGLRECNLENLNELPDFDFQEGAHRLHSSSAKVRSMFSPVNKVAAILLGFLMVTAVYLYWGYNQTERLFALEIKGLNKNAMIVYASNTKGADTTDEDKSIKDAIKSMNSDDKTLAIKTFETLYQNNKTKENAYLLALTYLNDQKASKAIEIAESVMDENYNFNLTHLLTVAHLKARDKSKAREYLQIINNEGSPAEKKQVSNLLEKL